MGWLWPSVSPTGHEGTGEKWEHPEHAHDDNHATNAVYPEILPGDWSQWLYLTHPGLWTTQVMWWGGYPLGAPFREQYELRVNGAWVLLYKGAWGGAMPSLSFSRCHVNGLRIRWYNHSQRWPISVNVEEVEFKAESCPGLLRDICIFLRNVGTFFINLSLDIATFWVIGGFLAAPFDLLGELFHDGAEACCSINATLQTLLDGFEGTLTPDTLLTHFWNSFPTLHALVTDPVGWFLVQLTLAFNLEPWHTQSLEFLAKWILETYFPTLYQIWLSPEDWFAILLEDRFPLLYYLVVDPIGEFLYLIGQAFDLTPWEAQSAEFIVKALFERYFLTLYQIWLDPEDWLVEHVDPRVLAVPIAIAVFLDDPWGWLFDRLEDQLETHVERIGEIAAEIIARLLGV